jgi:divalent metal cation (Fe/Co/Zn/Cd) transporter
MMPPGGDARGSPQPDETRGLVIALATNLLLLVLKLVAYAVTGVMVLLAEALHSLSDIFISGLLLAALL